MTKLLSLNIVLYRLYSSYTYQHFNLIYEYKDNPRKKRKRNKNKNHNKESDKQNRGTKRKKGKKDEHKRGKSEISQTDHNAVEFEPLNRLDLRDRRFKHFIGFVVMKM